MKAALVIMAAGMGSRYGGNKQVDGIGPNGEILMEYSIFDALRAGFTKVVFIIKPDMRDLMENMVGKHLAAQSMVKGVAGSITRKISHRRLISGSALHYNGNALEPDEFIDEEYDELDPELDGDSEE